MITKLFLLLSLFIVGFAFAPQAFSQTPTPSTCPPIYNGGIVCQEAKDFSINKTVQTPKDGSYVDKIATGETKIEPGRTMIFRIEITNKTTRILRNIAVTDTLPAFVSFVKSDVKVKQTDNKITYTISSLEPQKSTRFNIETKIGSEKSFPQGDGPVCVANQAEARTGFNNLGRDYVTFCIERVATSQTTTATDPNFADITKGGVTTNPTPTPVMITKGGQTVHAAPSTTSNPNTGPELLALIGLFPAGLAGFWLRKKTDMR